MKAIILAAGKGKRMRPLTLNTPKPLLRVLGKPILEHTLRALPDAIDTVIIVIGYLGEHIREYIGDSWSGRAVHYVIQDEFKGTGDAVMRARKHFEPNERFLVLNGDDLYAKEDLEKLLTFDWAILAKEVSEPSRFGVMRTDAHGNLIDIIEKPKEPVGNLINIGAYIMDARYFDAPLVSIGDGEYGLPQTLQKMVADGVVTIRVERSSFWIPLGYPEDIEKAEEHLRSKGHSS